MGLRSPSLGALAGLLAIGLFAASPFFNRGLVGTGEAFNYSLSVADSVTQMRHGVYPPLAGQTEYAFNGRIHPLRNAPYLHYLAAFVDLVTWRRLTFWQIQNVSLVLSLFGGLFGCYLGLRWSTGCPRLLAVFLAGVYALAPPLLGAAFTFDLYMTVHAAVFVPLALAACVRGCRHPSFSNDAWLAASLAGAWLAHPPVALWLTASVILVRLVSFAARPRWVVLASGLFSAVLGVLLAAFVFASAATLSPDLGYLANNPEVWKAFPDTVLDGLRGTFPGSILPVSAGAGKLSDLQLGYVSWALLGLVIAALSLKPRQKEDGRSSWWTAAGCALAAVVLLVLDLPVPHVTLWAWKHMPFVALELTTQWPMQRLYLVAVGLCVFGAGAILPGWWASLRIPRWLAPLALCAAFGWVLLQARPFIARGIGDRITLEETQSYYRPSNLDLTITSYAFVGPPPTYVHGVMDPQFEFRILRNGKDEISSPLAAALADSPVVQKGTLGLEGGLARGKTVVSPKLTLVPGHRYLLEFAFRIPPVSALVMIKGPLLSRGYILPEAGEAKGFGMMGGQPKAIPLWTDSDKPEPVEIRVWFTDQAVIEGNPTVFADYALRDVDMGKLPVRLQSLLPLRFTVDAPQGGCTVETPRRFIPGYAALVNGRPAIPIMSPSRQVMIPIPAGRSVVELSYPGPLLAREAFWMSVLCWLGFWAWRALGSPLPADPWACVRVPARWMWRRRWFALAAAVAAALSAYVVAERARQDRIARAVGPMRIDFLLPYGKKDVNEPLLATGHATAGVVIFAHVIDERHVDIAADVWGSLFRSDPIEVDFSEPHTLVVSDGALYPPSNPRLKRLAPDEIERLRSELVVELDGKAVIRQTAACFETTLPEILVGRTTFGSLTGPEFRGSILRFERLPVPHFIMLPASRHAQMSVRFPLERTGRTEPLLTATAGADTCLCAASYLAEGQLRLSLVSNGGPKVVSRDIAYDPTTAHVLEFWPSTEGKGASPLMLSCTFDGAQVLGPKASASAEKVPVLVSGINSGQLPGVEARFTGPKMEMRLLSNGALPEGAKDWGTAELVVSFPIGKTGRHEPLLTTGATGAGDFIYVVYSDLHHIRLGFDHWGGSSGLLSPPIEIDYQVPHEVWVSLAPLYPDIPGHTGLHGTAASELGRLRSQVRIALDGRTVVTLEAKPYTSAPGQVTFFENRIGGSTADPKFSGVVHFLDRIAPSEAFP